jgi:membrane protein required for colicin V production
MAVIDYIILSLAGWGFYKGLRKGLLYIVLSLAGIVLGFVLASRFSGILIPVLSERLAWSESHIKWTAYVLVFIIVLLIARLVSYLLEKFFEWTGLGWMNRLAGGVVSALKYLLLAGLLFTAVDEIQKNFKIFPPDTFAQSTVYEPLVANTRKVIDYAGNWKEKFDKNKDSSGNGNPENESD